jgi:transketolase
MKILGIPDENVIHATPPEVFRHYGFDYQGIYKACVEEWGKMKE